MSGLQVVTQLHAKGIARQLENMGLPAPFESMECAHGNNGFSIIRFQGSYWISQTFDLKAAIEYIRDFGYDGDTLSDLMRDIPAWCISQPGGIKAAVADSRKALRLETCTATLRSLGMESVANC